MKITENKKFDKNNVKDSKFMFKYRFFEKLKIQTNNPSTLILVQFRLNTNDQEFHIVSVKNNRFKLYHKEYLTNWKYLEYNRTLKMWLGLYHEDCSLPIKQVIDANEIKQAIAKNKEYAGFSANVNPEILRDFSKSKVVMDAINGHAVTSVMMFLKVIIIINVILTGINLILNANMSGIFAK